MNMNTIIIENEHLNNWHPVLSDEMIHHLQDTMSKYGRGNESKKGYKRLASILSNYEARVNGIPDDGYNKRKNNGNFDENYMKQVKHFFDTYNGDKNDIEYILNGGDKMKKYVDSMLKRERRAANNLYKDEKEKKRQETRQKTNGLKPYKVGNNQIYITNGRKISGNSLIEAIVNAFKKAGLV